VSFDDFLSLYGHHVMIAGVTIALALSLNLINGCAGLFSLGHQGFWMAGAYTAALLTQPSSDPNVPDPGLGMLLLSIPAGAMVAALFGLIVGVPCLRLRGDYLAIATLGFGEILCTYVKNSTELHSSAGYSVPGIIRTMTNEIFETREGSKRAETLILIALAWGVALLTLIVLRNLMRSAHGRAIVAIREDETAAEILGVNLTRYKVLVFVVGAAFAGMAGAVYAHCFKFVSPDQFDLTKGITLVAIVVLGGMGSFTGTIVAAIVVYALPVLLANAPESWQIPIFYDQSQGGDGIVRRTPKELWQVLFSLLLIIVILLRPQGLMGRREFSIFKLWAWLRSKPAPPPAPGDSPA